MPPSPAAAVSADTAPPSYKTAFRLFAPFPYHNCLFQAPAPSLPPGRPPHLLPFPPPESSHSPAPASGCPARMCRPRRRPPPGRPSLSLSFHRRFRYSTGRNCILLPEAGQQSPEFRNPLPSAQSDRPDSCREARPGTVPQTAHSCRRPAPPYKNPGKTARPLHPPARHNTPPSPSLTPYNLSGT